MLKFKYLPIAVSILFITNHWCNAQKKPEVIIVITTDYGEIRLKLYNETPLHRDNFIKLIESGYYTDRIFHRVINHFMIQGGDESLPESSPNKTVGKYNYTIPAEFNRKLYHKKGALVAARMGDDVNPNKESSSTQFYIVQGQVLTYTQLTEAETQINNQLMKSLYYKYLKEEKDKAMQTDTSIDIKSIQNIAFSRAKSESEKDPFKYSEKQITTYTTKGGAPYRDMNYTVFGEVIFGLKVLDKIAAAKTSAGDRPAKDIKFSIKIYQSSK